MPVNAIESGVGDVWQAKQSSLGTASTPTDSGMKHLRITDGALKPAKTYGSEEWVDGQAFGSPSHYVNQTGGEIGSVTFQAQPETAGWMFAQTIGSDVVTGASDPYTHTISSGTVNGTLQTIYTKVGVSVGPWRNQFYDAKVNKLTWNCGQDQEVAHLTEELMAANSGVWSTSDPTAADSGTDPFIWTEGATAIKIDDVSVPELEGETLEIDRKLTMHYGDSVAPTCFVNGKGEINRTFSGLITDGTLPIMKNILYGSTSPGSGSVLSSAVSYVKLETTYTRSASRSLKITTPKVAVKPDDFEVFPRAEGGKIPVAFGGMCLKSGATPAITVVAKTSDSAAYA